jgi:uncharacterized membrane protein YozB (DUF420 family)
MSGDFSIFPVLNAGLNAASAVLLGIGYMLIRRKRIAVHRKFMLAAVGTSGLFLLSYLYYHFNVGSVRFQGTGWPRTLYFAILLTHTVLAASLVVLVPVTLVRGLRERYDRHRAIARWTYPIWMYVSVTGVVIYLMLYQIFAAR